MKSRKMDIRSNYDIVNILLKDRTTNKNIIWATSNYEKLGLNLSKDSEIDNRWITNGISELVQPRVKKDSKVRLKRTKRKAEVFTPTEFVREQNNLIDRNFKNLTIEEYTSKIWLEITCGEGPYICSRYDATTGLPIKIEDRVGFLDKKLYRITNEIESYDEWYEMTIKAYKSCYGYEFQGDSLLIARENLLYTFIDYYYLKFSEMPQIHSLLTIANIISYNIFQMDGTNFCIPYSEKKTLQEQQLSLFTGMEEEKMIVEDGLKVIVKDWSKNRLVKFEDLVK